jgi:dihydrofolate reductase
MESRRMKLFRSGAKSQHKNEGGKAQMSKVRIAGFAVSLDGFSAGIEQSLSDPLGKHGAEIGQWCFHTRSFRSMLGEEGGSVGDIDDEFFRRSMDNIGAFILGRNMFGPVRGPWLNDSWKGWWGDNPPFHVPAFVLTDYEHARGFLRAPERFADSAGHKVEGCSALHNQRHTCSASWKHPPRCQSCHLRFRLACRRTC